MKKKLTAFLMVMVIAISSFGMTAMAAESDDYRLSVGAARQWLTFAFDNNTSETLDVWFHVIKANPVTGERSYEDIYMTIDPYDTTGPVYTSTFVEYIQTAPGSAIDDPDYSYSVNAIDLKTGSSFAYATYRLR